MIDKSKNVCYVNTVTYFDKEQEIKTIKLLSQHGVSTKRFDSFYKKYLEKTESGFSSMIELTQWTVSKESWKNASIRVKVMSNITEKEKCY